MLPLFPPLPEVGALPAPRAGTVLDTESLVLDVVKVIVQQHGKTLTAEAAAQALGMRPLDAWAAGEPAAGCCRHLHAPGTGALPFNW
jgi:hypothetical protein